MNTTDMQILDVAQGTPEWNHERAISDGTASEAPAMMGVSSRVKRNELLHMKATGTEREFSDWVQKNLFDKGHEYEVASRPFVEELIGDDLFPATGVREVDGLSLLASFDGMTMDEETLYEHKMWNEVLAEAVRNKTLEPEYYWQLEQQLLVSKAKRVIFVVSDGTPDNREWMEYTPVEGRAQHLIAGWKQFQTDLANYEHVEVKQEAVAAPQEALPAVAINVSGEIALTDNLQGFGAALRAYIERINQAPETDQDFADLEATVKTLKETEERLDAAEANALAQVSDIDVMRRAVAQYRELARSTRLAIDKLVKAEKDNRRAKIVQGGRDNLAEHVAGLNARFDKPYMPQISADFAGAIKGKRTIASLHEAVDTTLANAKIEANRIADDIQKNLKVFAELAKDFETIFPDLGLIVLHTPEHFELQVKMRISEHKAAEAAKAELEAAKKQSDGAELSPAAQHLHEAEGAARLSSAHPSLARFDAQAKTSTPPTLKLGTIKDRLGFALSEEFVKSLGFEGTRVKGACLFHESDFQSICGALTRHIANVMAEAARKAA